MTPPTRFALVIHGSPWASQCAQTAWHFAVAALRQGHAVERIFLYGDGVYLASALATPPRDEVDWSARWRALIDEHQLPATACIASALRRGILDQREAERHERPAASLAPQWRLAGLGDWIEAEQNADRVLFFGETQ